MTSNTIAILILAPAICLLILALLLEKILYKKFTALWKKLIPKVSILINEYCLRMTEPGHLNSGFLMQELLPSVSVHVDLFLKEKLKQAFPLLHQFMGEKTLVKFREIFLEEIQLILPEMIGTKGKSVVEKFLSTELIKEKLHDFPLDNLIKKELDHYRTKFYLYAIAAGLIIGVVQLLLWYSVV